MGEIFISHASPDAAQARRIAEGVRQAGHRIFLDSDWEDGIAPGAAWQKTLLRELRLCDAVVFLNSSASQASVWCHSELVVATELGKRVYSLDLAPGLPPHPLLQSLQGIRFETTINASIQRLTGNLGLDGLTQSSRFKWERGRSPYPGLAAMDVADAGVFFGREEEVRSLVARVDGPLGQPGGNLVVVMGPSGAGKSSLVRAGLVARLAVPRSGWVVAGPLEPGARPLARLASRLAALAPGQLTDGECRDRLLNEGISSVGEWLADQIAPPAKRVLITVDQAEQLATVTPPLDAGEFLTVLGRGLGEGSPVTVVMTVRSDRFDEIQQLPVIGPVIHSPFVIAPMNRSQLAAVIEGPARRADLTVAPGLAGRLIEDAVRGSSGEAVDALPFLAFSLREMYDLAIQEDRDTLTGDDYERVGRIEGAIIRRTEAAESLLPPGSEPVLERLLPRFVTLSEDRLPAGRPVPRERLTAAEQAIVEKLEDQRLLTGAGETVRLAHEQLITAWPRLAATVAARRDDLLLQARIERQASDWKRGNGELLGRDATITASSWLAERAEHGTDRSAIGDYIRASHRALRLRRARLIVIASSIVALALAASAVAVVAGIQRSAAVSQSHLAQSEEMAAEATNLFSTNTPLAMLLSLQAFERAPTVQARSALIEAAGQPLSALLAEGSAVESVAFSPNGQTLAAGDTGGDVGLWDTGSGRRIATLAEGHSVYVYTVAFSPNGQTLAVGDANGHVGLWDIASGRRTATLAEGAPVISVTFSPNGQTLAVGDFGGHVGLWDVASGRRAATLAEGAPVASVAFSQNGQTLAVGDFGGHVGLWDVASGRRAATLAEGAPVASVAFSQNGQTLAAGDRGGHVGLWDVASGRRTATLAEGDPVYTVAFSPNGQTLAVGDLGGHVGLWDSGSGRRTATLAEGHPIYTVAFSPNGQTLAAGDYGGDIGLWDSGSGRRTATLAEGHPIYTVAFSPNGQTLAAGSGDLGLWDTGNGRRIATLAEGGPVISVAFSPDGQMLAAGDTRGHVVLWDTASSRRTATLTQGLAVYTVAFSPDGQTLAVGDSGGDIGLWDVASGRRTVTLAEGLTVDSVAFSPDGRMLAAGDTGGDVGLWDTSNGRRIATLAEGGPIASVAFSPDGRMLAVGDTRGDVGLWDIASGRRTAILAEGAIVNSVAFSPDGHTLAIGDSGGDVSLWDIASGRRTTALAEGDPVYTVAFSPDGQKLAIGKLDGDIALLRQSLWDLTSGFLARLICHDVHRNMTQTQWIANAPGQPYQKTCSAYP